MKDRRLLSRRLWIEELETRIALSGVTSSTSSNWSGYAVTAGRGTVTDVVGSWVQPSVSGSGTSYSSFWVGIDGANSNTVEQIGTDSDLVNGKPSYYAWVEMYPAYPINLTSAYGFKVSPGDSISAEVDYSSSYFYFTLKDNTQAESIELYAHVNPRNYALSSAEWIAEAPSSGTTGKVLTLAPYGSVSFSGAAATIGGTTAAIDGFTASGTTADDISMVNSAGTKISVPTSLTDSGNTSSFVVNGPTPTSPPPASPPPPPPPPTKHHHGPEITFVSEPTTSATVVSALATASLTATPQSAAPLSQPAAAPLPDGAAHSAITAAQPAWLSQAGGSSLGAALDDTRADPTTGGQPELPQPPSGPAAPGNQPATRADPGRVPMQTPTPATTTPTVDLSGSDIGWNRPEGAVVGAEQQVRAAPVESGGSLIERGADEGATAIEAAAGLLFAFALRGSPAADSENKGEQRRRPEH